MRPAPKRGQTGHQSSAADPLHNQGDPVGTPIQQNWLALTAAHVPARDAVQRAGALGGELQPWR
eukprot:2772905-Pyramimonas_sp.AAC.1